jgi:hypothetical protein
MTGSRLERVLEDDYLAGLDGWSTARVREARAECEAEEEAVSYTRRVLQGRLDILRAELVRREEVGDDHAEDLLGRLPAILSSDHVASPPARARSTRLRVPDHADELERRVDELVGSTPLRDRDTADLAALVARLADHERWLSGVRRQLFDRIDALRDELAGRYKDGRAAVSELLGGS